MRWLVVQNHSTMTTVLRENSWQSVVFGCFGRVYHHVVITELQHCLNWLAFARSLECVWGEGTALPTCPFPSFAHAAVCVRSNDRTPALAMAPLVSVSPPMRTTSSMVVMGVGVIPRLMFTMYFNDTERTIPYSSVSSSSSLSQSSSFEIRFPSTSV